MHVFLTDREAFSRYWMDVRHGVRKRGLRRGLRLIVGRAAWDDFIYFDRLRVFSQPVPDKPVLNPPRVPLTFRLATEQDIPLFEQIYEWPSILREHAKMIRNGNLAILALDGDRLVGLEMASIWTESWSAAQSIDMIVARCFSVVPHEDAYLEALYVAPEYRGKGVATSLGLHLLHALHERGIKRVFTVVSVKNIASLRTSWSIGGQIAGEMTVYQVANWLYVRVTQPESVPGA